MMLYIFGGSGGTLERNCIDARGSTAGPNAGITAARNPIGETNSPVLRNLQANFLWCLADVGLQAMSGQLGLDFIQGGPNDFFQKSCLLRDTTICGGGVRLAPA